MAGGLIVLIALFSLRRPLHPVVAAGSENGLGPAERGKIDGLKRPGARSRRSGPAVRPASTAEEIVATKVSQFARDRRQILYTLARRKQMDVPGDVERFFDAVERGHWEEIEASFKLLSGTAPDSSRPPGVQELWSVILDTFGAAEQAHLLPAQKLLDYGHAVLDSLRPGMVYVGGTDPGRWVPELLNDTSDGERHIVITQNGLADKSYQEYVDLLYGGQLATFTEEESARAFQDYVADARKRLEHDQQFPDEPKQVRPGETVSMVDGRAQVSGQVAVMAINEKLLQTLLEKNPSFEFALQESFPLKGTYPEAAPLGPIMELRAQDRQDNFPAEQAAQSVDYWRATTQRLLSDPEATTSPETLKTYSHDVTAQANLLAAHNYTAEAEQAYRLSSQLWPGNPEPVRGIAEILSLTGRPDEARRLVENFGRTYPDQRAALEALAAQWRIVGPPAAR